MINKNCFINIFRAKTRSLLTISAIAVGVFAVVLISTAGDAGRGEVTRTLEEMGINSIIIQNENVAITSNLSEDYIQTVANISGVERATPLMACINRTTLLDEQINSFTWGINADAREIISLEALHGRLITTGDMAGKSMVAVIEEEIALAAYGRSNVVGKTVRIYLNGMEHEFEIVGVAKSGISTLQSALSGLIPQFVYIPLTTMQMLTGRSGYDKLAVMVESELTDSGYASTATVIDAINDSLIAERGENSGVIVSNLLQQREGLENILATVTVVLSLIAGISLLVSGLTVMTTMLVSVGERKREIGIKKSIGARDFDIAKEFLWESVTLSATGSIIGAAAGLGVTAIGCRVVGIAFMLNPTPILAAIAVAVGLGGLFGAYPAIKAARLAPVDALRL